MTKAFAIEMFQAPPMFSDSWKRIGVTFATREAAQAQLTRDLADADCGPESFRIVEVQS